MNLIQTVKAIPPLEIETPRKEAQRLFLSGIEQHVQFNRNMKIVRRNAVEAGFFFLRARAAFNQGEWGDFVALYKDKVSIRTVQFYMQLADMQAKWVLYNNPELRDLDAIKEQAIQNVLISPLPLVQLCRADGEHMLKFGGYFKADYEEKKAKGLRGGDQIEFDFGGIAKALGMLNQLDQPNVHLKFADDADEDAEFAKLEQTLETALAKVREARASKNAIKI